MDGWIISRRALIGEVWCFGVFGLHNISIYMKDEILRLWGYIPWAAFRSGFAWKHTWREAW